MTTTTERLSGVRRFVAIAALTVAAVSCVPTPPASDAGVSSLVVSDVGTWSEPDYDFGGTVVLPCRDEQQYESAHVGFWASDPANGRRVADVGMNRSELYPNSEVPFVVPTPGLYAGGPSDSNVRNDFFDTGHNHSVFSVDSMLITDLVVGPPTVVGCASYYDIVYLRASFSFNDIGRQATGTVSIG